VCAVRGIRSGGAKRLIELATPARIPHAGARIAFGTVMWATAVYCALYSERMAEGSEYSQNWLIGNHANRPDCGVATSAEASRRARESAESPIAEAGAERRALVPASI
jgi:hypothetical protein